MVTNWPGLSVPRAQGYGVLQAPLLETKEIDGELVDDSVMPVAAEGPLFCTLTVSTKPEPAEPVEGPVTETATSALAASEVVAVLLLFVPAGSAVVDVTLALV